MLGRVFTRPVTATAVAGTTMQFRHELPNGGHLAYRVTTPRTQSDVDVVFVHGLLSTMSGTKATALECHAREQGHGYLCFDARGHGSSSGTIQNTSIADWYEDTVTAMQLAPATKHILVGSSFGGWQALHAAVNHPQDVAGLVLVAPALDITEQFWKGLSPEEQQESLRTGQVRLRSQYVESGGVMVNKQFFDAAKRFLVLDQLQQLQVTCPVRILHGMKDQVVPVATGQQLFEQLPTEDMILKLVKDGDHQLSRPHDVRLLLTTVQDLLQQVTKVAAAGVTETGA